MSRSVAARWRQLILIAVAAAAAWAAAGLAFANVFSGARPRRDPLVTSIGGRPEPNVSVRAYAAPADYKRVDRDICAFPVETHEVGKFETLFFRRIKSRKLVRIERGVSLRVTFTNVVTGKSVKGVGYRQQTLVPNVSRPQLGPDGLKTYHWQFKGLSLVLIVPKLGPISLAWGTEDVYFKFDHHGRFVSYYGTYQTPPWPETYFDTRLCELLA